MWPFATLGWPNKTTDLERYYPNNVLVTGYDIIPFWVNRMTFQGLEFMDKRPFKDCIIHGLIRDKQGRKMSKSLGNGVDPMDVIEKYGADSLRFFLTTNTAMGLDLRYDEEKVRSTWNFINKLWNASRYVLMNIEDLKEITLDDLKPEDKWILTKLNITIKDVTKKMEKYDFNLVGNTLYSFVWDIFCDKYIELSKFNLTNTKKSVLCIVLTDIIKLLHPFMPYVTEEIYSMLPIKDAESIMISSYPVYDKNRKYLEETKLIDNTLDFVTTVRNKKQELNIGKDYKVKIEINNIYIKELVKDMLKLNNKEVIDNNDDSSVVNITKYDFSIDIIYDNSQNKEDLERKQAEEIKKLTESIARRKKLLSNSNYLNKAPSEIVAKEKKALEEELSQLESLK